MGMVKRSHYWEEDAYAFIEYRARKRNETVAEFIRTAALSRAIFDEAAENPESTRMWGQMHGLVGKLGTAVLRLLDLTPPATLRRPDD